MNDTNINGNLPLDASQFQLQDSSADYGLDVNQQENSLAFDFGSSDYFSYTVNPQDTLWDIADRETDDPLNWKKFRESDGTNFTSDEARKLQIGSTVYIPKDILTGLAVSSVDTFEYDSPSDSITNYAQSSIPTEDYIPYAVKPNDTLWDIASKEFGDPYDWIAIIKADGTNFTEKEAKQLQINSTIYLPKNLAISSQSDQVDDVVVTPTSELKNYLDTIQSDSSEGESNSQKNEDSSKRLNNPFAPFVQPNLGYKVTSDKVFEGGNINAGLFRAVVVDDKMEGKISFEPNWEPGKNSFLEPDYVPTLNLELSNLFREAEKSWETDIIDGLLKWDESKGFSFHIGELEPFSVWVSELEANAFDPKTGSPTTDLTVAVEGELNKLIPENIKSQDAFKHLDLANMTGEIEYSAKLSWKHEPPEIFKPLVPEPVTVYVNDSLPQYNQPRQPAGINPYPLEEIIRQSPITPPPIMEPESVSVPNVTIEGPNIETVTQPTLSPVTSDTVKDTNPINNFLQENSSTVSSLSSLALLGVTALAVGGYAATAPVSLPATLLTATAGVIGLSVLRLFGDSGDDELS